MLTYISRGIQITTIEKLWWQKQVVSAYIVPTVNKLRKIIVWIQPTLSFLFSLEQQPMEWYCSHLGWVFSTSSNLIYKVSHKRAIKDLSMAGLLKLPNDTTL